MIAAYFSAWINQYLPSIFAQACSPDNLFFFIPAWYKYLELGQSASGGCEVVNFDVPMDFLAVGLAIIDMLTRLAGLVIVVVVIAAGVSYITSQGNAEKATGARRRIINGFIGLAIVFVAAGLVAYIGNKLN